MQKKLLSQFFVSDTIFSSDWHTSSCLAGKMCKHTIYETSFSNKFMLDRIRLLPYLKCREKLTVIFSGYKKAAQHFIPGALFL